MSAIASGLGSVDGYTSGLCQGAAAAGALDCQRTAGCTLAVDWRRARLAALSQPPAALAQ
jgi:hypothetical protein